MGYDFLEQLKKGFVPNNTFECRISKFPFFLSVLGDLLTHDISSASVGESVIQSEPGAYSW